MTNLVADWLGGADNDLWRLSSADTKFLCLRVGTFIEAARSTAGTRSGVPRFPRLRVGTFIEGFRAALTGTRSPTFPRFRVGTFFEVGMGAARMTPQAANFLPLGWGLSLR